MLTQRKHELIRKARVNDVVVMKQIINTYSKEELMLARSLSEMYENIRDYYVCEIDGEVVGCCALHEIQLFNSLYFKVKLGFHSSIL